MLTAIRSLRRTEKIIALHHQRRNSAADTAPPFRPSALGVGCFAFERLGVLSNWNLTEMDLLKKAIIYVHGKGGSYLEAERYKQSCVGFDIVGVDYDKYLPWDVDVKIKAVYDNLAKEYEHISILANSIGAYFAMHTLQNCAVEKALFISPILNMEKLIQDMMQWAHVTEKELCEKGEIPTDFGETLSWEYLSFVRKNPIEWDIPTEILYAEKDNLTSRATVDAFIAGHAANLTVFKNGEHWFHTDEQIAFLNKWMRTAVC